MKIFLSKECLACQQIQKDFPDKEFLFVEDKIEEVKKLGLIAVPAIVEEIRGITTIWYGEKYVYEKFGTLIEDSIPF